MRVATLAEIQDAVAVHAPPDASDEVHRLLAQAGAVVKGHFALQSGMHADHIIRVRGFARYPDALVRMTELLAAHGGVPLDGVTLLSPESAGYLLGDQLARSRGLSLAVAKVDLLRRPTLELATAGKSPYLGAIAAGSDVVIVNDVASTGSSIDTLCELAQKQGARVVGVLLLAASRGAEVRAHLHKRRLRGGFLVEGRWTLSPVAACPQCLANDRRILPVAEFN